MEPDYDVVIVGGGMLGTSLLYTLANYSDVGRIALVEKHGEVAAVNSRNTQNSQTLHLGEIETNYAPEKAQKVRDGAGLLAAYLERFSEGPGLYRKIPKMVLGVGESECETLRERYEWLKDLFSELELLDREGIAQVEPKVIEGRSPDEQVCALYTPDGHTVNFQGVSQRFLADAQAARSDLDVLFEHEVEGFERADGVVVVRTDRGSFSARSVVVSAGSHSIYLAHKLGFGEEFTVIPVAGSFYTAPGLVNGKVYTVQLPKLPFAAVHADTEVSDPGVMRLGPIALAMPFLERRDWSTFSDFLRTFRVDPPALASFFTILFDWDVSWYAFKDILYWLPGIGKFFFIGKARRIVPSLSVSDLERSPEFGGVRPQLVDTRERWMATGEQKVVEDGMIFNITPSPGASVCLDVARKDALQVCEWVGASFAEERFLREHRR